MNLQSITKNKKLLIGMGVAAALGLGVLWARRGKAGAAGGASTAAQQGSAASGYLGGFNSTGTDVASWLGNQQGALQSQMTDFLNQLKNPTNGLPPQSNGAIPNDQWAAAAFKWLQDNNKWTTGLTPTMAQLAISDYLSGKQSVPPWEMWTINEILTGKTQDPRLPQKVLGTPLGPPATLPGVPWV